MYSQGIQVIESAEARIKGACQGVVSCADILSFPARDSVVITGGLGWDAPVSSAAATIDIPSPSFNLAKLSVLCQQGAVTARNGCTHWSAYNRAITLHSTQRQIVQLQPRAKPRPEFEPTILFILKLQCPRGQTGSVNPNLVVQMNRSPAFFENSYYRDVLHNQGLFTSDQSLTTSPFTRAKVVEYAFKEFDWQKDFRDAMTKMSQIEVLTGNSGEIRTNCKKIN